MKMFKHALSIFVLIPLLTGCQGRSGSSATEAAQPSSMGGNSGGGGKGILCPSGLRTLDIYEAQEIRHLTLSNNNGDYDTTMEYYAPKLIEHYGASSTQNLVVNAKKEATILKDLVSGFKYLAAGERLPLTHDATIPTLAAGCKEVQIAIYKPSDEIQVDRDYWNQLDAVNKVALAMHEYVYHFARELGGSVDSDESRRVIGSIMAGETTLSLVSQEALSSKHLDCRPTQTGSMQAAKDDYQLVIANETDEGRDGLALYFQVLKNRVSVSRVRAFAPGYSLDSIANGPVKFSTTAVNTVLPTTWEIGFESSSIASVRIQSAGVGQLESSWSEIPCTLK